MSTCGPNEFQKIRLGYKIAAIAIRALALIIALGNVPERLVSILSPETGKNENELLASSQFLRTAGFRVTSIPVIVVEQSVQDLN